MVKPKRTTAELYEAARNGERRALGRLLTQVERGGAAADELSELAHADAVSYTHLTLPTIYSV